MSRNIETIIHGRMSAKEKAQAWIFSIACLAGIIIAVVYLLFDEMDRRALYTGYAEAVIPVVSQIDHPFDAINAPVNVFEKPVMNVWPKNTWKKINLSDGLKSSITVMGQAKLQGRVYGVDLYHTSDLKYISPVDISMGWQDAATDHSFSNISAKHGKRAAWFKVPRGLPGHQLTNTHLVPADWSIYQVLKDAKPDDRIALTAWPVTVRSMRVKPWASDLYFGDRNCEILLITAVRLEKPDGSLRGEAYI